MSRAIDGDAVKRRAWDIAEAWRDQGRGYEALLLEGVVEQIVDTAPTLTPQNEWVSVEERLPDELKMVLVYCRGLYDVAGWVKDEEDKICWTCKTEPEFWRPIPELDG